jgi:hypothetical protein
VDEENGEWSAELGPTPQQEAFAHCAVNGQVGRSVSRSVHSRHAAAARKPAAAKARRRESPPP